MTNHELYFQAPTTEELNARHRGLSFAEFKQLTDDKVLAHEATAMSDWNSVCEEHSFEDQEFVDAWDEMKNFNNFVKWRKYGVPDRDLSDDDFDGYMLHYFTRRREADPNYGRMTPELESYLDDDMDAVETLLDINHSEGDPQIGDLELEGLCMPRESSISNLVAKGVLKLCQNTELGWLQPKETYGLNEPYLGIYLANQLAIDHIINFPELPNDEVIFRNPVTGEVIDTQEAYERDVQAMRDHAATERENGVQPLTLAEWQDTITVDTLPTPMYPYEQRDREL